MTPIGLKAMSRQCNRSERQLRNYVAQGLPVVQRDPVAVDPDAVRAWIAQHAMDFPAGPGRPKKSASATKSQSPQQKTPSSHDVAPPAPDAFPDRNMTSTGQSVEGTPQRSRADIESERAAVKLAAEKQEYERSCGLLLNAEAVRLTWSQHTEILQHALKTHPSKSARAICLALNLPMSQAATIEAVLAEQTDSIRDQLISATGDDDGEEQDQAAGPA